MSWLSGFNTPTGIASDGTYMYVSNLGNNSIDKITLSNNSIQPAWATGLFAPYGIAILGSNLFVYCDASHTVDKIDLSSGTVTSNWVSGAYLGITGDTANNRLLGVSVDNNHLASFNPDAAAGQTPNILVTGLPSRPYSITLIGTTLYGVSQNGGQIFTINMSTNTIISSNFASTGFQTTCLTTDGTKYLFACGSNNVVKIKLSDASISNVTTGDAFSIYVSGNTLYVPEQSSGTIKKVTIVPPATPIYLGNATVSTTGDFALAGTVLSTTRFPSDSHELAPRAYVDNYVASVVSYYNSILDPNNLFDASGNKVSVLDRMAYLEAQVDRIYKALWNVDRNVSAIVTPQLGSLSANYAAASSDDGTLIANPPVAPSSLTGFQ